MSTLAGSRRSLGLLRLAVATAVWVGGCGSDLGGLPTTLILENETGSSVTVIWVREDADLVNHGRIANGETRYVDMNQFGNSKDVCSDGQLIVYDDRGTVLLKGGSPCQPWVIRLPGQGEGSASPS